MLESPSSADVRYPGWFGINREYDQWIYHSADWDEARSLLADERGVLERIAAVAGDADEFYEQVDEYLEEERIHGDPGARYGLDLGVAGLVIALNAAGVVTASSCARHSFSLDYPPYVALLADSARVTVLDGLVLASGCRLEAFDTGLALLGRTTLDLVTLGEAVVDNRAMFEAMALVVERREPSGEWDDDSDEWD